jgi:hypothetical protein
VERAGKGGKAMRKNKLSFAVFAGLTLLLACSSTQAQQAFGYASITFDENTNTATGYASTELDYETAYYYDAEVQAHIEDENGNVLGSGQATGGASASTFFDVVEFVLCFRISIVSYVIVRPHFLGCNGRYFDIFGFSDFWFDWWWDFGDFSFERRTRCIFQRIIFIATIIHDLIRCLPAQLSCQKEPDSDQLLPSGFRQREETPYLPALNQLNNSDHRTIACRVTRQFTGEAISGVSVRFGLADPMCTAGDSSCTGGHEQHGGIRPRGTWNPTVVRTDSDGWARSVYTAPVVSGKTRITMTAADAGTAEAIMDVKVPNLQRLQNPGGNDGYVLTGSSENNNPYHPDGHYGTATANNALRQIAAEYRNAAFPNGQQAGERLMYNDQSLISGGKFDVTRNFTQGAPPNWINTHHDEHRVGINCDVSIRNVPENNVVINGQTRNRRRYLEDVFFSFGSSRTKREFCANHWHLRFEGGSQNNIEGATNPICPQRAAGSAPIDGIAASVPGVIQAERYDGTGADGVSGSFVPDDGNNPPDILVYNYPEVLPIPGAEESGYVPTVGGEWMSYTVNVSASGYYTFTARVASANNSNTFHLEVDGVDVTGPIYIPNTGSGNTYQFVSVDNIPLEGGQRTLSVVVDGAGPDKGNFDYFTVDPYYPPQYCNPEWWEIQDCQNSGGSWDYGLCGCAYYGCYNHQCEVY